MTDKKHSKLFNNLFLFVVYGFVVITIIVILSVIIYLTVRGLFKGGNPSNGLNINFEYLFTTTSDGGKTGGIIAIIWNTVLLVLLSGVIAGSIGLSSAIYLCFYAKVNKFTSFIRSSIEVLAGIPSIIFGLFGLLVFVGLFKFGYSLISVVLTLSIMILPTVITTSENALSSVDKSLYEACIGLGSTKMEAIMKVVIKEAKHGIVSGMILSIGRALGETAALVYTVGSSYKFANSLLSSARPLAMHIYLGINEGQSLDKAFASAFVLLILCMMMIFISELLVKHFGKGIKR